MRWPLLLALVCLACGTFDEARGAQVDNPVTLAQRHCYALSRGERNWGAAAVGAGALAGSSGLASIPLEGSADDSQRRRNQLRDARIALLGVGVGMAALVVTAQVLSRSYGADWARDCADLGEPTTPGQPLSPEPASSPDGGAPVAKDGGTP